MGYKVKMQKVERPTNKSFYINFPASIADSCEITKGERGYLLHSTNPNM